MLRYATTLKTITVPVAVKVTLQFVTVSVMFFAVCLFVGLLVS